MRWFTRPTDDSEVVNTVTAAPKRRGGSEILTARVQRLGLWALVIVSPVLAIVAFVMASSTPPQTKPAPTPPPAVLDTASRFVSAWMSASDAAEYAEFVDVGTTRGPETPSPDVVSVSVAEAKPFVGGWGVTVAVVVEPEPILDDSFDKPETGSRAQFYRVELIRDDGAWTVTGLPAMVDAPLELVPWKLSSAGRPDPSDARVATVEGWLRAYLVGVSDPDRFTAPGLDTDAQSPTPFVEIKILDVTVAGSDARPELTATLLATTARGNEQLMTYSFALTGRDGRWEIAELFPRSITETPTTQGETT